MNILILLAATAAIELPEDICLVDTVKVADCVQLPYNYAIGDTQVVYWKDCDGFTYSKDYLPDYSWDYMTIGDTTVANSGEFYTRFKFCGGADYAYFYRACPPGKEMPEPSTAIIFGGLCLVCLLRRRGRP